MFRYFNELSNRLTAEELANPGPVRWYHWLARILFVVVLLSLFVELV
jgi:hypothetical protein